METSIARVSDSIDRQRCSFETGDACNIRDDMGSFDVVFACNLICRLPEPQKFLDRLPSLVNDGGVAVLITPFSWLEEYTPKCNWLGGYVDNNGQPVDSFETLSSIM